MMKAKRLLAALLASISMTVLTAQAPPPAPIDTSRIGPQVGQAVPPFEGVDQFGKI